MAELRVIQIVSTPGVLGGMPRLEGRRISVQQIAEEYVHFKWTIDEIRQAHALSLAEIYAALSYYYANEEELERAIAEDYTDVPD